MEALADALSASPGERTLANVDLEAPVADVLVVDSYKHRADDRKRFDAPIVVAVDDLQRNLAVTIVVDPTPGAAMEDHDAASQPLVGPQYALVRRHLKEMKTAALRPDVQTLVVAVLTSVTAIVFAPSRVASCCRRRASQPGYLGFPVSSFEVLSSRF